MLKVIDVHKFYGNKEALKGINLEVKQGEIFGFIGHNGAGKTTLIRSIAGILEYEDGSILIDGINNKTDSLSCKKITAYIPDNPDLYNTMTGFQFLEFIVGIFEVDSEKAKNEIIELAKEFEIVDSLGDRIGAYSHGMKQKLSIISALIHHPKLLILDEPFVGLDPKASFLLKNKMKALCLNGSSIFFSTHVLDVAEKLCDRIAIIKEGQIVIQGKMEEIVKDASLEEIFLELENE